MESEERKRFVFRTDDDGHWYAIPVEKIVAFDDWVDDLGDIDPDAFNEHRIDGGPAFYSFTDLREFK